ncbi:putative PB1 domain-containing protein [Helianthus annuus]|uniref:PB1 domain-containing protein n=2 Tax=Helianthus annuus TaxID=4232 RepID=A0A9K3GS34_HELAN|nr:protein NLP7 isoform X2 [Helianthus annuus]KAF5753807.1 putative PB1 domain-containing protein [Helianthus annuus]KAJ0431700.1 putative PB1 domain-containing protein [Helianthus annuus]
MYPNSLDLKRKFQPVDYAYKNLRTVSRRQPTIPFSDDSRYMTSLSVFRINNPCSEVGADNIDPNHQKLQDRIEAALRLLTFREQHVLVQFWSPHAVGKHQLLETIYQPFGIGVVTDVGLSLYRRDSEDKSFVVDKDLEEEDSSPAVRAFRRGLPEWASDLNHCTSKQFPQQECAIRCNLHGYLALPVFDSNTRLCVGVLELLTSSKYMNYAHEVQVIHMALKTQNLISPQRFDFPALYVLNESRQNNLDKIRGILKMACEIHSLPLAQTWAVSPHTSFVSHEKNIEKSCSSFDTRCVRKVCMSTTALPFHVQDLSMWPFFEACRERHLDSSCGLVGKALLTHGSCFCGDVTKLSEEEYPLVHNARMNRVTSCFAIYLCSIEDNDGYVLEFVLPPDIKDSGQVSNLVQTLKQNFAIGSGFELGDNSCIQVVGLPPDVSVNMEPDVTEISSDFVADNFMSSDSESSMANHNNLGMDKTGFTGTDAGEKSKKRKKESVTRMVTAKISYNDDTEIFNLPFPFGLSYLTNEVSQVFKLTGKKISLKYIDEDADLILIACDVDLHSAVVTAGSNNSIRLICLSD